MKYRNYFVNRKSYREFYEIFVINMLEIKCTKIVLFELYDELFIVNCSIIIVSRYRIFCARDYLDYEKLSDFHDLHLSFLSFISMDTFHPWKFILFGSLDRVFQGLFQRQVLSLLPFIEFS